MRRSLQLVTVMVAMLVGCGTTASAADNSAGFQVPLEICTANPAGADGIRRQPHDSEVTGAIAGIPPRVGATFGPGERGTVCVGFQNRTGHTIDLDLTTSGVSVDESGFPVVGVDDAKFGAASWITLPAAHIRRLKHGDTAWMLVRVDVPADAAPGSWYASITASSKHDPSNQAGAQVVAVPAVAVQVFFDVPGDASRGGALRNVRVPHVVWWDGLRVGRVALLRKLRGLGIATVRFDWENHGSYSAGIKADVVIRSSLSGKIVKRIDVPERLVLRGSTQGFEATWANGIPMVGRFTPTLEVTERGKAVTTRQLHTIWVIPSWLYLAALLVALALPIWLKIRQRRRIDELYERLEAAEMRARAGGELDDDLGGH